MAERLAPICSAGQFEGSPQRIVCRTCRMALDRVSALRNLPSGEGNPFWRVMVDVLRKCRRRMVALSRDAVLSAGKGANVENGRQANMKRLPPRLDDNGRGVRTARGGDWHDSTVRNLLARAH